MTTEKAKVLGDFDSGMTPRELWEAHQKRMIERAAASLEHIRAVLDQATWQRLEPAPGDFYQGLTRDWRFVVGRYNEDRYDGTATSGFNSLCTVNVIRLPAELAQKAVEAAESKLKAAV